MANYTLGLENLISLIRAELKNIPYISSFEHISFEARRVQRGDLFIALQSHEISDAIKKGAYGIVYEGDIEISDSEIAWLQVKDIKDALLRLLRFHLMQKNIKVYSVDNITLPLFKSINSQKLIIFQGDIEDNLKKLFALDDNSVIIYQISSLYEEIFTEKKSVYDLPTRNKIEVLENTLFETTFIYKERLYERVNLAKLFIDNLQKTFNVLEDAHLEFKLKPFTLQHFYPVFINKYFKAVDLSQSSKVLIFEDDLKLFTEAITFLQADAPWAKHLFFIDTESSQKIDKNKNIFTYKTQNDLVKKLKKSDFNFALIFKQDATLLENKNFSETPQQLSLFE